MSTLSILLVLISAAIHIAWNSLTKSSRHPRTFSLFKGSFLLLPVFALPFLVDLSLLPKNLWLLIGVSGTIHAIYILSLSSAYEKGDISFVYPIVRSAPAFVPLAAYLVFAERVSLRGGSGIAIVVICILMLLLQGKVKKGQSIFKVIFRYENVWSFITLGTVVSYSITDKAGMMILREMEAVPKATQGIVYFLLENAICYLIYWGFMLGKKGEIQATIFQEEWLKIILASIGTMASYALILHVMKTEVLSYIVTLRQSSILFAVIVGAVVFREPHFRLRLLMAMVMFFGLYLTATG